MHVTQLLEALDLQGTGAETAAELELEGLRRDPDFARCKADALQVLNWTVGAMTTIEKNERRSGERPEALANRRRELESMRERLAEISPGAQPS